ncbi:unnamed protein product [Gongylonema pulchrum]|uniref:Reverse transcriptase domain-containing protein n=1 Tax=Gongylonema pulchrum TaxID=637853 RepID=A0A183DF97_9BILA|nr:unnamed protein product [Gongylonema pulchrum]
MEKYAGEVEEYMKLCFPNVRGRGRPIHGNRPTASPSSPKSTDSNGSRRGSGRYTHSHRRKGAKHPAQTRIDELLAMASAKRIKKDHDHDSKKFGIS